MKKSILSQILPMYKNNQFDILKLAKFILIIIIIKTMLLHSIVATQ